MSFIDPKLSSSWVDTCEVDGPLLGLRSIIGIESPLAQRSWVCWRQRTAKGVLVARVVLVVEGKEVGVELKEVDVVILAAVELWRKWR